MRYLSRRRYAASILKQIQIEIGKDPACSMTLAKTLCDLLNEFGNMGIFNLVTSDFQTGDIKRAMNMYAANCEKMDADILSQQVINFGKKESGLTTIRPFLPFGLFAAFFKLAAVHPPLFSYDYELSKSLKKSIALMHDVVNKVEILVEPYLSMNGLLDAH